MHPTDKVLRSSWKYPPENWRRRILNGAELKQSSQSVDSHFVNHVTGTRDIVRVRQLRTKSLSRSIKQAGFPGGPCYVKPNRNTTVVKAITAATSIQHKRLANDSLLEELVLENDDNADKNIKPYEQICTVDKTINATLISKENFKVSISNGTVAIEMYPCAMSLSRAYAHI